MPETTRLRRPVHARLRVGLVSSLHRRGTAAALRVAAAGFYVIATARSVLLGMRLWKGFSHSNNRLSSGVKGSYSSCWRLIGLRPRGCRKMSRCHAQEDISPLVPNVTLSASTRIYPIYVLLIPACQAVTIDNLPPHLLATRHQLLIKSTCVSTSH